MTEFELKLEVPPERLASVRGAMMAGNVTRQRLRARYLDTADERLAHAGIALRLRKEGRHWVQTAKCEGDGALQRQEHNVPVRAPRGGGVPQVLPARHAGTPVGERMRRALEVESLDQAPDMHVRFETDVERLTRLFEGPDAVIEAALDRGKVMAGTRCAAVCELEFELISGEPGAAVRLARQWLAGHGLWLSTRSKSARGQDLVAGRAFGPPVGASRVKLPRKASGAGIAVAVVKSCLAQVLANASEVGAGCAEAEHIHQLRVGMRRLRTALRELGSFAPGMDPAWEGPLAAAFRALGAHRDHAQLAHLTQPQLEAQGAPEAQLGITVDPAADPAAIVRAAALQESLLGVLTYAYQSTPPREGKAGDHALLKALGSRLEKLRGQAVKDGLRFQRLEVARQHRVRKRVKRLRYLAEFVESLFPARSTRVFLAALEPVQDALGLYNDELTALAAYRHLAETQPAAWFGVGWFSARRGGNALLCQQSIETFARARSFWR